MWGSCGISIIAFGMWYIMQYYYWHTVYIFFQTASSKNFLIDHHCETKSESSDSVAFVRIIWCSYRVLILSKYIYYINSNIKHITSHSIWERILWISHEPAYRKNSNWTTAHWNIPCTWLKTNATILHRNSE